MAQKHNLTIQVVSIIGGILTAIFFLGFLALARILRSDISCLNLPEVYLILTTLTISRMVVRSFSGCNEHHFIHSRMCIDWLRYKCQH